MENKISFRENCLHWLSDEKSNLYLEFMAGGDSFYRGEPPVSPEVWKSMPHEEKATLVEKILNRESLSLRYPGTFSGPSSDDLYLLAGLSKLEHLQIDSMQVRTYRALLDIPNLKSVRIDTFAHTEGYIQNLWCVFDALLYTRSRDFCCELDNIARFREELALQKPFAKMHTNASMNDGINSPELSFITEDYLYKFFRTP